jgi:hypothetical protein
LWITTFDNYVGRVNSVLDGVVTLTVAAGLASAIAMQSARDRWFPEVASPVDEIYFSSGEALGRMALSYKSLLADVYWIRAVQYFGGTRLDLKNGVMPVPGSGRSSYDLLYPLLDVATTLDPSFNIAYRFGATFPAEGYPTGRAARSGRGAARQGLRTTRAGAFPGSLGLLLGGPDYRQAAHWFSEAAKVPKCRRGCPAWRRSCGQGGDRRSRACGSSRATPPCGMREMRSSDLRQLDVADVADRLTTLLGTTSHRPAITPPASSR